MGDLSFKPASGRHPAGENRRDCRHLSSPTPARTARPAVWRQLGRTFSSACERVAELAMKVYPDRARPWDPDRLCHGRLVKRRWAGCSIRPWRNGIV